jgi:alpha-tubulin suppressor-like RCC1 family protein
MVLKDNPRAKFTDVACGKKHTLAIDNSGDVYATGDNKYK